MRSHTPSDASPASQKDVRKLQQLYEETKNVFFDERTYAR